MSQFALALKAEIIRLSRKEVKTLLAALKKTVFVLRRDFVALKRSVAQLEGINKRLLAHVSIMRGEKTKTSATFEGQKARLTARGVRSLRKRLGLSQADFGTLIGVSAQSVLAMEKKQGRLKLRSATAANMLSLRGIGKREARQRLAEMARK